MLETSIDDIYSNIKQNYHNDNVFTDNGFILCNICDVMHEDNSMCQMNWSDSYQSYGERV